jgi:hypothetical protein
MLDFTVPDPAPATIARLAAIGDSPADKRNALALLALISAGLDPERFASTQRATMAALELSLEPETWPRVVELLERAGIITGPGRSGRRGIATR